MSNKKYMYFLFVFSFNLTIKKTWCSSFLFYFLFFMIDVYVLIYEYMDVIFNFNLQYYI